MLPQFRRIIRSNDLFADAFRAREIPKKKVVLDFSSPNIAKTFHVGNLRSTLYGNFIQKLYRTAGHEVHSINYLGDWGMQFAQLALYWRLMDRLESVKKPSQEQWQTEWTPRQKVDFLTHCYAEAHKHIKKNAHLEEKARELFAKMEREVCDTANWSTFTTNIAKEDTQAMASGGAGSATIMSTQASTPLPPSFSNEATISKDETAEALALWREWRQLSEDYLREFYAHFSVRHTEWSAESKYVNDAHSWTRRLIDEGIAFFTADKMWAIRDHYISGKVVIRKSDGSSLYLSRDLAALFERDKRLTADEYIYVVDRAQFRHFAHVKSLVESLGDAPLAAKINHVSYGRVIGLSTRYFMYSRLGKNDSVDFLVAEGAKEARHRIFSSPTVRLAADATETADTCEKLARSVIVFDIMKRHRATEYTFSFKGAFKLGDNNALLLNTKYSRLCSMEKANDELMVRLNQLTRDESASFGRLSLELSGPAQNLARFIYEFDTIVVSAYDTLEPCILTNYLIQLSHQIGRSMAVLRVRGEVESKALPRLLLFVAAKRVLGDGMRMLGIEPLEQL